MNTIEMINFTTFPEFGCGAYESVIIRFKASPVQLNLPTGTEVGKKLTMVFYPVIPKSFLR